MPALHRYMRERSEPAFRRLADDDRGLPAVADSFAGLIEARCSVPYARWGCMVSNSHAGPENADPDVRVVLDPHHQQLRNAICEALVTLAPGTRSPPASTSVPRPTCWRCLPTA